MTAPDDVRARFEAWAVSRGMNVSRETPNLGLPTDCYWDDATESAWQAYRAAHADLSGDPRSELGNAEDVAQWLYANGYRAAATTIRTQLDVRNQRIADLSREVRDLAEADRMIDRCDAAIESHEASLGPNLLNYQVTETWADTYKALKRAHYKACIRREIVLMKLAKFTPEKQ